MKLDDRVYEVILKFDIFTTGLITNYVYTADDLKAHGEKTLNSRTQKSIDRLIDQGLIKHRPDLGVNDSKAISYSFYRTDTLWYSKTTPVEIARWKLDK